MRKVIFRPEQEKTDGVIGWLERKITKGPRSDDTKLERRYLRVHVILKNKLFKPIIKIAKRVLGNYMIKSDDDIPKEPYNNLQRIFYYAWQKGLDMNFVNMIYYCKVKNGISNQWKDANDYLAWVKKTRLWSWDNRHNLINIGTTEALDDTFDREWINHSMLIMYHEMTKLYNGNVPKPEEYPQYINKHANWDYYFHKFEKSPVWTHPGETDWKV